MASAISTQPRQDFWNAVYARLMSWAFVSEQRASFLADCLTAQSGFESSGWTSNLYNTSCNSIGYKRYSGSPWQDGTSSVVPPEGGAGYADYPSIEYCANELADWVHRRSSALCQVEDIAGYLQFCSDEGYATVPASQYANAEQYYQVTDTALYSAVEPPIYETVAAYVDNTAQLPVTLLIVSALGIVVIAWVFGLFKKLRF